MTKGEVLIKAEGVSKKFCRNLKRSLWYGFTDIFYRMLGKEASIELRKDEFWAVRNVSFEVRRGECLGLIGHNGAGKSTLLKMLNGLIRPDDGRIEMHGRVGALIELGAGFNPVLTGRENVYINGSVLGFTKDEIEKKYSEIVAFAELEEFMDMPVQSYSSGMKVRLGFAVAAQMEPDILIVDEVLAVGDMAFKLKCFNVLDELVDKCCVVFVSHSMQQISRMCDSILMMEKGKEKYIGADVSMGIDTYYSSLVMANKGYIRESSGVNLLSIMINRSEVDCPVVKRLDDLFINFKIKIKHSLSMAVCSMILFDHEQKSIGICFSDKRLRDFSILTEENDDVIIEANLLLKRINLSKGMYSLTLTISEDIGYKPIARLHDIKRFNVTSLHDVWPPLEFEGVWQ